jgi:hypothetical protein
MSALTPPLKQTSVLRECVSYVTDCGQLPANLSGGRCSAAALFGRFLPMTGLVQAQACRGLFDSRAPLRHPCLDPFGIKDVNMATPRSQRCRTESRARAPFRLNRNGALVSCFDAFSSREPVSTPGSSPRACFAGKRSNSIHLMRGHSRRSQPVSPAVRCPL